VSFAGHWSAGKGTEHGQVTSSDKRIAALRHIYVVLGLIASKPAAIPGEPTVGSLVSAAGLLIQICTYTLALFDQ
jgi:hypothetical protein